MKSNKQTYTFIDLFAGLGGFHLALQQLGCKCVFASELKEDLRKLYQLNFPELDEKYLKGDITHVNVNDIPSHDILCGGFPCQPFSQAGKRLGFQDEGRGDLFFKICEIIKHHRPRYIFLENVQDPSNLGAGCRSAEALGLDGLIVSGGCDIYNPKALRAAMGSSLRMPVILTENLAGLLAKANAEGMQTLASVPRNTATDIRRVDMRGGVICCVGNEGSGLSEEVIGACKTTVVIPMNGRAESFNASAAAAILAWELIR